MSDRFKGHAVGKILVPGLEKLGSEYPFVVSNYSSGLASESYNLL